MALLLPISFGMDATTALILFAGIYYGAMYGGSTTSILVNLPGEAASVITCLDGNQMAKKGRAGAALAISAWGSFIAGTISVVVLTFTADKVAIMALNFGSPEYFAICVLGLVILTNLTGKNPVKSLLMVLFGLALGTIGMDDVLACHALISATCSCGAYRVWRGGHGCLWHQRTDGTMLEPQDENVHLQELSFKDLYPNKEEWRRSIMPILRGTVIGFFIGLMPWSCWHVGVFLPILWRKRCRRHRRSSVMVAEGVAGPNQPTTRQALPPLCRCCPWAAFAAPALLLTAFITHGIQPGLVVTEHAGIFPALSPVCTLATCSC